jgi:hypothetical protein
MALRITVHERDGSIEVILEGRLAGPWVAELNKAWRETAPRLGSRTISLNLRDLTHSNEDGKKVLREIVAQTSAEILASDPLTKYLAQEISNREAKPNPSGVRSWNRCVKAGPSVLASSSAN